MATYVSFKKARRTPAVIRGVKNESVLWKRVKNRAAYTRVNPASAGVSRTAAQIDVAGPITGVPTLKRSGRRANQN